MTKQATTTRRTAKISKAERLSKTTMPYAMTHLSHVDAEAQIVRCTAKQDMVIDGNNGAKVRLAAGEEFFLARSDSVENSWYIIAGGRCSCPALKPCKHEKALAAKLESERADEPKSRVVKHTCGHDEIVWFFEELEVAEMASKPCHECRAAQLEKERLEDIAEAEKIFGTFEKPATSKAIAGALDVRGDLYGRPFSLRR